MTSETETARGFYERLRRLYQERLPFNRLLGLSVTSLNSDGGTMSFSMREDLIGNVFHRTLHGGVISSVLDAVGGLTASASLMVRAAGLSEEKVKAMFAQVGTIDLRVDYLRPGRGERFTANGRIMRTGRKVAVVRMEMHNEDALLVAVGTGTYMVG
ncbi:thioesterase family protein [Desulfosarcina sp.]|uniref:thioesterase family protein n=1 Tax=Desulfosarcina sp. TaxID=2027861 RepID=UPI003564DC51